ncbi:class F sortase [Streptomyces sp. NBRC 14336]|uniref:class F sortase n=1 Tax=Streptomyces sp. NBRC 14336 TaxID=3030992 RepID=UPI0024A37174|nr:class F sortase [Streptomyces sp. NBRC 14336]WBO75833.1 class F sortase [Streptomyces sp. SBE_14.2]GLW48804.1 class F sortase [Streptomyces sp. NBRC 14336]
MSENARRGGARTAALIPLAVAAALLTGSTAAAPDAPPVDFGPTAGAPARSAATAAPGRSAPPKRVRVPAAGLDARIRPVGVTEEGAVAVPADPERAGWYRFGPAPGSVRGSAVLVGHVDSETGALGEFAALYDVRPGDRVEVRRTGAEPVVYRVASRTTVSKDDLPSSVFRRTGAPVLTLITCAPPFVPERGGYQANLVVTARPLAA